MLGFIAGMGLWGFAKASLLGAHRTSMHALGGPELLEELQFRVGVERVLAPRLSIAPHLARLGQAALFGLMHPGLEVDAALGGYVYSKAYEGHGLVGAVLSHVAHNAGVWLGSKA